MSEQYTPTTDEVRLKFAYEERPANGTSPALIKAFDRWLDKVKADALREAAAIDDPDHYTEVALGGGDYVRDWLNARADRIEADQ